MTSRANQLGAASRLPQHAKSRNTPNFIDNVLRTSAAPESPVIAGKLLTGDAIIFSGFLVDRDCSALCDAVFGGDETSAGKVLAEFRKALEFPGYYRQSGALVDNAATRKMLKKFARRAYRGDSDRRGVVFWERVAWLLWNFYSALMGLRGRAEKIKQQEIKRIESVAAKRAERAAYMRRYRARRDDKRRAKGARYVKPEAKLLWRKKRHLAA